MEAHTEGSSDTKKHLLDQGRWSVSVKHVRAALKFIKAKGAVTTEQLVEWDNRHGRQLFTWEDEVAGEHWRLHEARLFLNHFRAKFDGLRVRAFINVPEQDGQERAYYCVQEITKNESLRALVVADITKRMANLAKELRMWKLSEAERTRIILQLEEAMGD